MTGDLVRFGGAEYFVLLGLLLGTRGADFLSTWVATPRLVLEGNPLAKKLGWRWGTLVNAAVCLVFAAWPLSAIVIATTSALVAARNFQSAWLMRMLGEEGYRDWYVRRLQEVPLPLYVFCLAGQTGLVASVGAALMLLCNDVIPFAIGLGIVAYTVAVAFYTTLSVWRLRRSAG
jgi:hypothetical protein